MDAMDELVQLFESMRQAASLLADDDPSDDATPRRPSTFLNAVALGNVVSPTFAIAIATSKPPARPRAPDLTRSCLLLPCRGPASPPCSTASSATPCW
jgi:hypothetical protein